MTHWFNIVPLLFVFVACTLFLISSKKSIVFVCVALIMIAEFIIDIQFGSLPSALVRLVASLSALLAIFLSMKNINLDYPTVTRNAALFKIIAYVMFASLSVLLGMKISSFLQIPVEITMGGMLAIFCGLLLLGISTFPSKVIVGIIILYEGFATIYGIVESSLLVNGLISAVLLLLGGLGTYFAVREITIEKE